jgi:hypothetical protein
MPSVEEDVLLKSNVCLSMHAKAVRRRGLTAPHASVPAPVREPGAGDALHKRFRIRFTSLASVKAGSHSAKEGQMAFSQWWSFNDSMVNSDRDDAGVYELANSRGEIIYIGSSNAIRRRLKEHLSEDAKSCIKKNAAQYRVEYRSDYQSAERSYYDTFVRQYGRQPQCNEVRP